MFNPLRFIGQLKQALILKLIRFVAQSNQQRLPMIIPIVFFERCNPKKLRASNDRQYDQAL